MKLQIIGGGKMGEALIGGLVAGQWATPEELMVVETLADRASEIRLSFPGIQVGTTPMGRVDTLVAVKPDVVEQVLSGLRVPRVLSIAAGVRIARIEAALGAPIPVVRAMPNTPALVGLGAAAIAGGSYAQASDLAWARGVLESVGTVVEVQEADLDAVTGVSGSGPAYVFLLAEALRDAAITEGLDETVAMALVEQTLLGAATLLAHSGESAETLRANVTSPNGTTAAGIAAAERGGFRELIAAIVEAATMRSRELGG